MLKFAFIFTSLFSSFFFLYLPLSMKNIEYYSQDMCSYSDTDNIYYVKGCEKGYQCISSYDDNTGNIHIGTCQQYIPANKKYNENCSGNDCETDLKCDDNKKCVLPGTGQSPYKVKDPVSGKDNFYCSENLKVIKDNDNNKCSSSNIGNYCLNGNEAKPDFMRVCGKIEFEGATSKKKTVSNDQIGKLELSDKLFVEDEIACKTGIYLYFAHDGSEPSNADKFKMCVNVTGVSLDKETSKYHIRYKKGGEEDYIYIVDNDLYSNDEKEEFQFLMLKQALFQNYLKRYQKLEEDCLNKKYYDEPYTCRDDELRKLWYFYNNPKEYSLYKDYPEVINSLIESYYPTSYEQILESKNSKRLLFKINLYFIFLILLSF